MTTPVSSFKKPIVFFAEDIRSSCSLFLSQIWSHVLAIGKWLQERLKYVLLYLKTKNSFALSVQLFSGSMGILEKISLFFLVHRLDPNDRSEIVTWTKSLISLYPKKLCSSSLVFTIIDIIIKTQKHERSSLVLAIQSFLSSDILLQQVAENKRLFAAYQLAILSLEILPHHRNSIILLACKTNLENAKRFLQEILLHQNDESLIKTFLFLSNFFLKPDFSFFQFYRLFLPIKSFKWIQADNTKLFPNHICSKLNETFELIFPLFTVLEEQVGLRNPSSFLFILRKLVFFEKEKLFSLISYTQAILTFWPPFGPDQEEIFWTIQFISVFDVLTSCYPPFLEIQIKRLASNIDLLNQCVPINQPKETFFLQILASPPSEPFPLFVWEIPPQSIGKFPQETLLNLWRLAAWCRAFPHLNYLGSPAANEGGVTRDFITKLMQALCSFENLKIPGKWKDGCILPQIHAYLPKEIQVLTAVGALFYCSLLKIEDMQIGHYFHPLLFKLLHSLAPEDLNKLKKISTTRAFDPSAPLVPEIEEIYLKLLCTLIQEEFACIFGDSEDPEIPDKIKLFVYKNDLPKALSNEGFSNKEEFIKAYQIHETLLASCCIAIGFCSISPDKWTAYHSTSDLIFAIEGIICRDSIARNFLWEQAEDATEKDRIEAFFIQWLSDATDEELKQFIISISGKASFSLEQKITIRLMPDGPSLPSFHTCFISIDIPKYQDYPTFKKKLEEAIHCFKDSNGGFHFK